jgi:hypothetical protein
VVAADNTPDVVGAAIWKAVESRLGTRMAAP